MDRWQYMIVLGACLVATAPLEMLGATGYRRPTRTLRAVLPTAAVFVLWDVLAVAAGVWTYDPRYVTGVELPARLPLEELLFFLVIPLSAVLTYSCVQSLLGRRGDVVSSGATR